MIQLQDLLDEGRDRGLYSGAAAAVSTPGGREFAFTGTHAYGDGTPVGRESLFDLASISKTFTSTVILRLVESGALALDEPVADLLPVGSGPGSSTLTLRMLLTHTSGLPDVSFLWRDAPEIPLARRLSAVLATALDGPPGAQYRYSCLGYIAAAAYAERATGRPWPQLLRDLVLDPLDLRSVGYGPVSSERAVATEEEPWAGRGLVRGEVHDETAWFLGGVSGNAGLFGTVDDLLVFARSFLDEGLLGVDALLTATTDQLDAGLAAPYGQGIGPRIGDRDLFGDVVAFGHPGFTGTLWLAIPDTGAAAVLLTNRVHPARDRVDLDPFRQRFTRWVAER